MASAMSGIAALIVVGSGVAGLTAALEAVDAGHDVTLLTKSDLAQSNTRYAQGGVAVVMTSDDTVAEHVQDTLIAGAGLSDEATVEVLCSEGPAAIRELIERGVQFDRHGDELAHGLEAAHSHARILHAGGDATGAGIAYALIDRLRESGVDGARAHDRRRRRCSRTARASAIRLLDGTELRGDAVVLATGGAGQLFPYTTNPEVATADGLAMALRAGAIAADLEFYQFHPTSLAAPGNFLVSEAVRGEGAVLIDEDGHRFMTDVHPDAELAPRDVVARGIAAQMARQKGKPVRLDATALGGEFLAKRFPNIDAACRAQGFDWGEQPIPVTPAAHYYMGGIRTDEWGRTSVPGLYAVGEAACNGLHGANRLASNSLLEGRGLRHARRRGARAARGAATTSAPTGPSRSRSRSPTPHPTTTPSRSRATTCSSSCGTPPGSRATATTSPARPRRLASWRAPAVTDAKSAEDANLLVVARAVVASASARQESRGGHYRTDFPEPDPAQARHSAVRSR